MTPRQPTYRLLDRYVGWHALPEGIEGLDSPDGVTLARQAPGAVDASMVAPRILPPRLAYGFAPGRWYVVGERGLLRWSAAERAFRSPGADAADVRGGTAVGARRHRVAVSRLLADEVVVFARDGQELVARLPVERPGPVLVRPDGQVWVCGRRASRIRRFGPDGVPLPPLPQRLPPGRNERLVVGPDRSIWLVTSNADRSMHLWCCPLGGVEFRPATLDEAEHRLPRLAVARTGRGGFELEVCHTLGGVEAMAFDWHGSPLGGRPVCGPQPAVRELRGQLIAGPIDSGIARCRWHRVRIEAEVPRGSRLSVAVATAERPTPVVTCPSEAGTPEWRGFTVGPPHAQDWQVSSQLDWLIDQPPGRYLYLRLRLEGDGEVTPVIHRVRLDFPRETSLEHLPGAFRRDPLSEDFTERYLSLFDAAVEDDDRAFERSAALLDARRVPPALLDWLGHMLDVTFDPEWGIDQRREVLAAVPDIYRRRGTLDALRHTLRLTLGAEPALTDIAGVEGWGALGHTARVSGVRLFGRHRARLELDAARLGQGALHSYGDPVHDARRSLAHRVWVSIPRFAADTIGRQRVEAAIQRLKPAHVQAQLRVGHSHIVVGRTSMVGIDTILQTPPRPVLGGPLGNVRLRSETVIRPARHGRRAGLDLGHGGLMTIGRPIGSLSRGDLP